MSILFPAASVKNAPGQILLVQAGVAVTFATSDFVANLSQAATLPAVWDFGDGTVESVTGATTAHTYASPGRYQLSLQTNIGGAVQTTSWQVRALLAASAVQAGQSVSIPWVAAVQTTFGLQDGQIRHAFVLAPLMSAVKSDGNVGQWGAAASLTMSSAALAKAVDDAATRWQHAWSTSFGRMEAPRGALEQGIWAHCTMESIPVGISSTITLNMADLESAWRELQRRPTEGHRAATVARALSSAGSLPTSDLAGLQRLDRSPTDYLDAGEKSVRMPEVMRWLEYLQHEANDATAMGTLQVARWHRIGGPIPHQKPTYDAGSAWGWEVAQAAMQVLHGFYYSFANLTSEPNVQNASALVLIDPSTGQASLRVTDTVDKLWFQVQAGPVRGSTDAPRLADLPVEGGPTATGWVGARGVGVAGSAADPTGTFDVRRIESLFSMELRQEYPTFGQLASTTFPQRLTQQAGLLPVVALMQDGATRRTMDLDLGGGAYEYIVDVVRPAERAEAYDGIRGGLRPHAAMAVAEATAAAAQATSPSGDGCSCIRGAQLAPALPSIDGLGIADSALDSVLRRVDQFNTLADRRCSCGPKE